MVLGTAVFLNKIIELFDSLNCVPIYNFGKKIKIKPTDKDLRAFKNFGITRSVFEPFVTDDMMLSSFCSMSFCLFSQMKNDNICLTD